MHADTPHLFDHVDCLPCHYANVFTPGYDRKSRTGADAAAPTDNNDDELDADGNWTGNSSMGGTAFVEGSHRLSVSAMLTLEEEEYNNDNGNGDELPLSRRDMLRMRTIRPALEAGDVVFFDNRTLHYGLANDRRRSSTNGGGSGEDRRPMLYLNCTQSWFHDPKNWDDRESIFSSEA